MRKLALPLLIVVALGATSAMAATTTPTTPAKPAVAPTVTNGMIKALSAKACTVTLDNKTTYYFAAKCDFSKLKVGEKVAITWTPKGKKDLASKIEAVS
jgi:curli biogenesis system outer membrane secretion channel CsgG